MRVGGLKARDFNQFGGVGGVGGLSRRATQDNRRRRMDETVVSYVDDNESATGV